MSKTMNQDFQSWKIIEQSVRCHTFHYGNRNLSVRDNTCVQDVVVLLAMVWCECFTPSSCSFPVPRFIPQWIKTIKSIPWDRTSRFFKLCDDILLSFFLDEEETPHIVCYDDFKHHLREEYEFAGELLAPARKTIDAFLHYHGEASAFLLHQAFSFCGRTSLRDLPELEDSMLKKFSDNCDRVMMFKHDFSTDDERRIIRNWFLQPPLSDSFHPRHGTGCVSEQSVHSIQDKYLCGGPDMLLRYVFRSRGYPIIWPFSGDECGRMARVKLVPKNSTSFRTITMEPACLMYYQQGIRSMLVDYIHGHPQLSGHIDLSDQTCSRELCKFCSSDGEYVTIDLSMASDSISMSLFRAWFRDTWIYPLGIASRSTTIAMPDGNTRVLPFYAGMGNATTFPIQCIVYAAICEATIAEVGPRPGEIPYRVYGDDIIIHRRYASVLMRRLSERGFIVNRDKSYYSHSTYGIFRESCGAEYLNGNDIKPVRIPRKFSSYRPDSIVATPELYGNIISLANEFLANSLQLPYLWLVHCLNELPLCIRPLFGESDGCLHTRFVCSNHQIQKLWSSDYYSAVAIHGVSHAVTRQSKRDREDIRLFESLRLMEYRKEGQNPSEPITVSRPNPLAIEPTETILSSL